MFYGTKDNKDYGFFTENNNLKKFIEISDKEWQNLLNEQNNNNKSISHDKNGNPILVDSESLVSEKEKLENKILSDKSYLKKTDYIVMKIAEGVSKKKEYADILEKRKEARKEINDLENELKEV